MESRMEKYYKENLEYYKRSKRNEALYRDITRDMNDLDNYLYQIILMKLILMV